MSTKKSFRIFVLPAATAVVVRILLKDLCSDVRVIPVVNVLVVRYTIFVVATLLVLSAVVETVLAIAPLEPIIFSPG